MCGSSDHPKGLWLVNEPHRVARRTREEMRSGEVGMLSEFVVVGCVRGGLLFGLLVRQVDLLDDGLRNAANWRDHKLA